jgi:hypothetical protein
MKNQDKISTNIQKTSEKKVNSLDLNDFVINNLTENTTLIKLTKEINKENNNDKSIIDKNEKNNNINIFLKEQNHDEKHEIKLNFNIPFDTNILKSLKGTIPNNNNFNEINSNMNSLYKEKENTDNHDNLYTNPNSYKFLNLNANGKGNIIETDSNLSYNQSGHKEVSF